MRREILFFTILISAVVMFALLPRFSYSAGFKAPELVISEWINGDPGSLESMKGKVVVIDFFQMWCPGCNSFALPLMRQLEKRYKKRHDIVFLFVHTVFEGHTYQTPDDLKEYVIENGIKQSVGIDGYAEGEEYSVPVTMRRYRTGGTPCITVIDKKGFIKLKKLGGFKPLLAETLIDQLLSE